MSQTLRKIYISGMHSGQNPCSGVGIARCLKKAFPEIQLVGVDHWQGCSGLHDSAVDEVLLLPQWKQMDDQRHADQVRSILNQGHLWISSMDMEVHWLSENLGPHQNLLAPGGSALLLSAKPAVRGLEGLDIHVPEFISASLPDSEIHTFLRHNSWQCWLKSPYHDAKRISSWGAFEAARAAMSKTWKTSNLFLQKHVMGHEETIAFTAYQGKLLGATLMQKRQLTPEGKTWAAKVTAVDAGFFERFGELIRRMEWSGGGEVEYVRDPDGRKWMIECNPRFPAWIFGGALTGNNLPAKLVSHVWNLPLLEVQSSYRFFTRVVQEIPAKEEVGIPLPPDPTTLVWSADGKKGKGAPALSSQPRLQQDTEEDAEGDQDQSSSQSSYPRLPERVPPPLLNEVQEVASAFQGETPARIHLENWTRSRFRSLASNVRISRLNARTRGLPEVRIGFSVKTSPTDEHLRKARENGFYAECISQMEVHRALEFGYQSHEIILNGPGKFWPITQKPVTGLHMLFCDSTEEFERVLEMPNAAECIGFRLRLPKVNSRFGNALDQFENFQAIIQGIRKLHSKTGQYAGHSTELGFHFHMPSWAIGVQKWTDALHSLLIWCQTTEQLTSVPVRRLDLGGGFFPTDLEGLNFEVVQKLVHEALPSVESIYFEPGRSLTQDGEVLVSRVLDVRKKEIVVDACIAELPLAQSYSHRIFYKPQDSRRLSDCRFLDKGPTRVLGRICMEDDILSSGLDLPDDIRIGDLLIFGDAGGYERTMSYGFGRG